MPNFKNSRMAEDIKREMTAILRELKDPRIDKMLTIVRADLSGDMSNCKIYVSSFEGMERTVESVKGLKNASGFVRRELFHRLKMRKSPELTFVADNSIERSAEISRKLNDLNSGAVSEENEEE
ncbi:MAG: 30S ribosome-binding factor RbfA [Ruminococcus sp.]|nr:30S ribosome-binding factor RbfA [Ruminococcus sp.]MBQ3948514.1 30S ribosome-binding factor RbfA [Ruminococcus sp.]MBR6394656.1 30S ribosome-binding factor RbfA [Ruminococcus sp.]MCR5729266.1 30S ribosome-binding factor RbfA [Ruminococcus sp.]